MNERCCGANTQGLFLLHKGRNLHGWSCFSLSGPLPYKQVKNILVSLFGRDEMITKL